MYSTGHPPRRRSRVRLSRKGAQLKYYRNPRKPPIGALMFSILIDEPATATDSVPAEDPEAAAESSIPETGESEFVLNMRQMASLLFVAITMVVAFSAVSYMVGRASGAKTAPPRRYLPRFR